MKYQKKKRVYGSKKKYSVINKLFSEEKINEKFLVTLNLLTLEEVIAVKLEMAAKASGGNIYGIPVWNSLREICRDAALKFALTSTRTMAEAALFLGITFSTFKEHMEEYEVKSYFEEK